MDDTTRSRRRRTTTTRRSSRGVQSRARGTAVRNLLARGGRQRSSPQRECDGMGTHEALSLSLARSRDVSACTLPPCWYIYIYCYCARVDIEDVMPGLHLRGRAGVGRWHEKRFAFIDNWAMRGGRGGQLRLLQVFASESCVWMNGGATQRGDE